MSRIILHVDFDSFFASCEQHFNPNLRGKPIGVVAENGRNAVIAASREAKKAGVKSPNTTWEAKRICPEIIFVKADFERYLEITKKLLQIASRYSPIVEMFSLDEVFLDLTDVLHLHIIHSRCGNEATHRECQEKAVINIVQQFKKDLAEQVGPTITASMGVSYNKLLAKLATNLDKPDGFAMITRLNREKIMANLQLSDITGIGRRYEHRLNMIGIFTFKDLADYPMYLLKAEFGNVASQHLKALSMGIDDSPVISYLEEVEAKSVGRNYCLPENTYDQEKNLKTIYELCEEVAIKLRRLKMKGRTIGLFLHGGSSIGERKTIGHYTNRSEDIFEVCKIIFNKYLTHPLGVENPHLGGEKPYVRQVSVWAGNLIEEQYDTIPLFEPPKKELITKLVDQINDRFGHHTIRKGYLVNAPKLHTKPNGFGADRWQRKEIAKM